MFIVQSIAVSTLFTTLLTASSFAQPAPAPEDCIAPPSNATKEEVLCYESACDDYQADFAACQSAECRAAVTLEYAIAIIECTPALLAPTRPERESWISLIYVDGQWSFEYGRSSLTKGRVFYF